jgi:hypothetical protein
MTVYRIVVQGELSDRFASCFEGVRLETGDGETALVGDIVDQAQLQGVLSRLGDLGLVLLRLSPVEDRSLGRHATRGEVGTRVRSTVARRRAYQPATVDGETRASRSAPGVPER